MHLGLGLGFCLWSILKSLFIIFDLSFTDFVFTFLFSNTINTLAESQSIDQLRITFVAILKLYLIALGERPPSQSGASRSGNHARPKRLGLAWYLNCFNKWKRRRSPSTHAYLPPFKGMIVYPLFIFLKKKDKRSFQPKG
jgi:hypothetical protein